MSDNDKQYWVVQVISGTYHAYGPYRSEEGRDNRYKKVRGGEVHTYDSWETDPDKVIDEFKAEAIG